MSNKKIYFASDLHLGYPNFEESLVRERLFIKWLDEIKNDAAEIYLLGDIFDFWFEYKKVVPRGFTRFLGKLCELTDSGIPVHFFTGNHDIWVFDYLPQETGVVLHNKPFKKEIFGKKFFLAHGDGLGPNDNNFKRMKKVFTNSTAQWMFARLHPNLALKIAQNSSKYSRLHKDPEHIKFHGKKEWIFLFAKEHEQIEHADFYVFGHRHVSAEMDVTENSKFFFLGDWLNNFTYGVFDGEKFELKKFINN